MRLSASPLRRLSLAVTAAAGVVLVTASCAASPDNSGSATPVEGGDLQASITVDPGCLDPHQTSSRVVLQWGRQVADSLVFEGEGGVVSPWLASEYSVNDDATQFTFTVRDDVTFSDGSTLDAETVKANFDALKALGSTASVAATYLADYTGTEVIDDSTAVISFSKPNAQFLYGVSTPNLSLYSAATATLSAEALCAGDYAGSGPFAVDDYVANEKVVLTANKDYAWGSNALENTGAPHLDTVTFNIIPDSATATGAAASGELDIVWNAQEQDIPTLDTAGFTNADTPEPALSASWIVNPTSLVGTDAAIRKALMVGVDREMLLSTRSGSMTPATGILNSAHPFYHDQSDVVTFDQDEAIDILEADGWTTIGSDGVRTRDGERLSIDTIFYTPGAQPAMELAKQQLLEIGLELTLTPTTANDEIARMASGDYDMRVSWFTGPEPTVIANVLRGADATVDEYITEQASTTDFDARSEIVNEFTDYIAENALLVPLWEQNSTPYWSPATLDVTRDVAGLVMFSQVTLAR